MYVSCNRIVKIFLIILSRCCYLIKLRKSLTCDCNNSNRSYIHVDFYMAISDEVYSDGADDVTQQSSDAERAAELSKSSSVGGTRARQDSSSSGSSDGGGAGAPSQ